MSISKRLKALKNHQGFRRYASNSSWLLVEQGLRAVVGIIIGIYVARYLGPHQFGIFSYLLSIVAVFSAIARLGLDGILVREFVQHPEHYAKDLGTAFWLMIGTGCLGLTVLCGLMMLLEPDKVVFTLLAGSMLVFQSFNVTDWFFKSQVRAKVGAIVRVIALVISSIAKILAVYLESELIVFFVILVIELAFSAVLYWAVGRRNGVPSYFRCFSKKRASELLHSSWPLMLTALAVILYMKMDQLMIKYMLGEREVGIYSAAVKFYEGWVVFIWVISVSLLPAIINAKSLGVVIYQRRLVYFFRFIFWISVTISSLIVIYANEIIFYSFGPAFEESASVLGIVMFTTVWAALGSGTARYLVAEKMEKKIALRTVLALVVNGVLNFLLIPRMGIQGAAIASLVCTFIANYLIDWFDDELSELLSIKHRAIFFLK